MATTSIDIVALLPLTLSVALAGCGGNSSSPSDGSLADAPPADGGFSIDAHPPDLGNPIGPPPVLGPQLDRAGRAAISPLLNGVFQPDVNQQKAQEDAYGVASNASNWISTQIATNVTLAQEFSANIAIYDAIDLGNSAIDMSGCGNTIRYLGPPNGNSYEIFTSMLADDQIYVDTSRRICTIYMSLELEIANIASPHVDCGGRKPTDDVIDMTYSMLSAGIDGLDFRSNNFAPKVHDGVSAHPDVSNTDFPFLGPPH